MFIKDKDEILEEIEERDPDLLKVLAEKETDPDILAAVADNDPYGNLNEVLTARADLKDAKYDKVRTAIAEHADIETLLELFKQQKGIEGKTAIKLMFEDRCPEITEHMKDLDICDVASEYADILPIEEFYDLLKLSAMKNVDPSRLVMAMGLYARENESMLTDLWTMNFEDVHRDPTLDSVLDAQINEMEKEVREAEESRGSLTPGSKEEKQFNILGHIFGDPTRMTAEQEFLDDVILDGDDYER